MYRLINQNAQATAEALSRIGDLGEYIGLRAALAADPAAASTASFQRSYRKYWRMNAARLSDQFYANYFATLAECRQCEHADVAEVARRISSTGGHDHGLQFSFATKLAHMVDPRVPVYDSFVANFYFYSPPTSNRPLEERLASLVAFHGFLTREYARILELGLLRDAIAHLKAVKEIGPDVPDERIVDWLIWAWVSLLRQGAQHRGDALYR